MLLKMARFGSHRRPGAPRVRSSLDTSQTSRITVPRLSRRHHHRHQDPIFQKLHNAIDWTCTHLTTTEQAPTLTPMIHSREEVLVDADPSTPYAIFAQPTSPAMANPTYMRSLSAGQTEIATLAGGTAVLVSLLFIIMYIGVSANKDVYDNKVGLVASLRRHRFFYERWRVPSLAECAELSRKGSDLFRSRSNSIASSTSFEYPIFGQQTQDDDVSGQQNMQWAEKNHGVTVNMRTATPHPEDLFIVPAHQLTPERDPQSSQPKSSFEEDSESEYDGPMVVTPRATRVNIIQRIAEWEAQEEEKYEKLLARVRHEEAERLRWREKEYRSAGRARSVSRGRSHSRVRLSDRKSVV